MRIKFDKVVEMTKRKIVKMRRKMAEILRVHTVRKPHIFQYIVGLDLTFNVDFVSKWDIWREFAKIKEKENITLRWLMNKMRSNFSWPLVLQAIIPVLKLG